MPGLGASAGHIGPLRQEAVTRVNQTGGGQRCDHSIHVQVGRRPRAGKNNTTISARPHVVGGVKRHGGQTQLASRANNASGYLTPVYHRQCPHCLYDTRVDNAPEATVESRIGLLWREIRRGAGMNVLLEYLLGTGDDALEPGEWDTLELLAQEPLWRMGDLARAMRVDPSTATRAVQRLIRAGYAERSSCVNDGRVTFVTLTQTGRLRYDTGRGRRQRLMHDMLDEFQPAEREQFAAYLQRFVDALDHVVAELDPGAEASRG